MSRNSTAPGKASTNLAETTIVGGAVGLVRSAVKEPKVVCKLVILNSHVFHQWRLLLGCALCHDWMSWFVSGGSKKFWQCNSSTSRISKMVSRIVEERYTDEAMGSKQTVLQQHPERLVIQRSHAVAFYDAKRP